MRLSLLLLLCFVAVIFADRDFYKILGVAKNAGEADIKRAYRKLSLQYHPDKNPGDKEAASKFQDVAAAYEALSDPEKRQVYDRHGENGLKEMGKGEVDPFASMFGGFGFGFGGQRGDEERRTPDVRMPLSVNLEDLYLGRVFEIVYYRHVMCINWGDCQSRCPDCSGPGMRTRTQRLGPGFVQQVQTQDDKCVAKGKCWDENCSACPKGPTEQAGVTLTVDVRKGMMEGDEIVFNEVADEKMDHTPGNLVLRIQTLPHPFLTRDGDNLKMTMEITLKEALVGFERTIKHLDGRDVLVKKDSVTDCSEVFRVKGEGMPRKSSQGKGDLFIDFRIVYPRSLTESQKQQIRNALS